MLYRGLAPRGTIILDEVSRDRRATGIELASHSAGSLSPFGSIRGRYFTKLVGIALVVDIDGRAIRDSSEVTGDNCAHGEDLCVLDVEIEDWNV